MKTSSHISLTSPRRERRFPSPFPFVDGEFVFSFTAPHGKIFPYSSSNERIPHKKPMSCCISVRHYTTSGRGNDHSKRGRYMHTTGATRTVLHTPPVRRDRDAGKKKIGLRYLGNIFRTLSS